MKYKKLADNLKALEDPEMDKELGYNNEMSDSEYNKKMEKESKGDDAYKDDKVGEHIEDSDDLSAAEQAELAKQIGTEFKYCKQNQWDEIQEHLTRLKLYNNQKRQKNKVGDPLLFTVHQTVLASLYADSLQITWKGREEGDNPTAANLNNLAMYDFDVMDKDIVDYEWDWDAAFFGRGLLEFTHFDRETLTPIPEVIDPTTFLRDPRAASIRGNKLGKRSIRFAGQMIGMTMWEMENQGSFINLNKLKSNKKDDKLLGDVGTIDPDFNSLLSRSMQERAEAQGSNSSTLIQEEDLGANRQYELVKWYTYFDGKRCVAYLDLNTMAIVRYHIINTPYFPLFDRPLYPMSHSWRGTSIADITEDKQRLRSILLNVGADAAKAATYTRYFYDKNKIKNRADLDFAPNKHIAVDGAPENAVVPGQQASVNSVLVDYILQSLDAAAQKATATPEIQQGAMSDQERTLGELQLIASKSSTRYALTAKVFGWSEKRYWQHWYWMYKHYMEDTIDEKSIRIGGAWGDTFRKLTKENIINEEDPDVQVVSKAVSEAQKLRDQVRFEKFVGIVLQDPTANKRYALKKLADLYNLKPDEISRLLPFNTDELVALEENDQISNNIFVPVEANQNHILHLDILTMAAETPAKRAHAKAHRSALMMMRENPSLFPNADPAVFQQAGISAPLQNVQNTAQGGGINGVQVPQQNQGVAQQASESSPDSKGTTGQNNNSLYE